MLVLSRQRDEVIIIGDGIEVTVVDIRGDKVRLGINAPKEVAVDRKEVYEAIKREGRAAGLLAARIEPALSAVSLSNGSLSNGAAAETLPYAGLRHLKQQWEQLLIIAEGCGAQEYWDFLDAELLRINGFLAVAS